MQRTGSVPPAPSLETEAQEANVMLEALASIITVPTAIAIGVVLGFVFDYAFYGKRI